MRHTSVLLNGNEHCYGFTDVDVRDTFEEEAAAACARLKGLDPEAVFTSPLQRAAKLAAFCGYPDAIRDDRLKEMNFGDWEGKPWEEILDTTDIEAFIRRRIATRAVRTRAGLHPGKESCRLSLHPDLLPWRGDQLRPYAGRTMHAGECLCLTPSLRLSDRIDLIRVAGLSSRRARCPREALVLNKLNRKLSYEKL